MNMSDGLKLYPPSHVAMAPDRGSLQKEIGLPGTCSQVPC